MMRSQPNYVEIVATITITIIAVGFNVDVAFVLINVVQENPYFGLCQKKSLKIFLQKRVCLTMKILSYKMVGSTYLWLKGLWSEYRYQLNSVQLNSDHDYDFV